MPSFSLRTTALTLLLALAAPLCAAPPSGPAPGLAPEQVAAEAFAHMRAGDWTAAAATFDPAALRSFRAMIAPILDGPAGEGVVTVFYGPDATAAKVRALDDHAFFADFMRGIAGSAGMSLGAIEILGAVPEGEDRRHLVTRSTSGAMGVHLTQMEVVTLNRTPGGWRLALSGKIDGMARALQRTEMDRPTIPDPPPPGGIVPIGMDEDDGDADAAGGVSGD